MTEKLEFQDAFLYILERDFMQIVTSNETVAFRMPYKPCKGKNMENIFTQKGARAPVLLYYMSPFTLSSLRSFRQNTENSLLYMLQCKQNAT